MTAWGWFLVGLVAGVVLFAAVAWFLILAIPPGRTTARQDGPGRPVASPPTPSATPQSSDDPGPSWTVGGSASWYHGERHQAAAGPGLRAALGDAWRGRWVVVQVAGGERVVVQLTDWCRCPGGRVIDLDAHDFQRLAPLSMGLVKVSLREAP